MTKNEKVANILAFLAILFGENDELTKIIMDFHPDYIIEKYERYILSGISEYEWGVHTLLMQRMVKVYIKKWKLDL